MTRHNVHDRQKAGAFGDEIVGSHYFLRMASFTMMQLLIASLLPIAVSSWNNGSANIPADSKLGERLLSTARRINENNDDGVDTTWISGYSIKFHSCHTTTEFRADAGREEDDNDGSPMEMTHLVQFRLCQSCSSCQRHSGDYVVELREFMETYLEMKEDEKEYQCEQVENSCSCEYDDQVDDEDTCLQNCYAAAGLSDCADDENDNNDDDFELDRYMECRALNENNDDSAQALYVGAYCSSNGKGVYLGTFNDRQCTDKANQNAYYSYMGTELPYSTTSLISNDCVSCLEPADGDDDANGDAVKETCEELYERSAKCERNLKVETPNNGGCNFIFNLMPQFERIAKNKVSPSRIFAWIFFLSSVALVGLALFLWKKLSRTKVRLFGQEGGVLA